ncbi:NEDD8-activating enzyme E1 regulatory subunit, partial [Lecanoromycetidae sp. Uapishka_2]
MVETSFTPPPLQSPTAKEKKYDRQLRLWAASGQQALENAKVLLLNLGPGAVGVEALKNLILPGIGSYHIVDDAEVTEKDLGVNFFLEESSLGMSRARETSKYLQELNPEVKGCASKTSIGAFIDNPGILEAYSLIILVGPAIDSCVLDKICRRAKDSSIPLFYVHSIGFYSHFSVQLPAQFPIVDTHPDPTSTQDLRLLNPWPELLSFMREKTENLETQSDHDHGHVPYILLLLHYLDVWKASRKGEPPANYPQKKEFKVMVEDGARRNNSEGGEENFDEAAAAVLKSLNTPSISSGLREVFEAEDCKNLAAGSANFWVIANAISVFYALHGVLPLPGVLPDMKAQSSDYIQLQNLYKSKARSDVDEVTQTVRNSERELGMNAPIGDREIEAFCKGAQFVKLIHGRPIRVAKSTRDIDWNDRAKQLSQELQNPDSLLPIYFAFLAVDRHQDEVALLQKSRKEPGNLKAIAGKRAPSGAQLPLPKFAESAHFFTPAVDAEKDPKPWPRFDTPEARETFDNVVQELDRADGAELHNVSALTGGMVAQEVIKVITKQYVPINNTCVFDGITSKTAVFDI